MSTTTTTMSTTTPPPGEKKGMFDTLGKHASNLGESFTGLFSKKKTPTATTPGQAGGRSRRRRRSRSRSRKGGNPKKGMASKSRKGRKDFVTHKGDKYYNRKGHRQSRNAKGKRKSPYRKH
jgi:hypothetical protein